MSKFNIKIGVICLARHTYDYNAAKELYLRVQEDMKSIENVDWVFEPELVITQDEAKKSAENMLAHNVDGIAIISGTFHLGHLALIIDREVKKPVLLWAFEELAYDGEE